jgi:hypothetical protein
VRPLKEFKALVCQAIAMLKVEVLQGRQAAEVF